MDPNRHSRRRDIISFIPNRSWLPRLPRSNAQRSNLQSLRLLQREQIRNIVLGSDIIRNAWGSPKVTTVESDLIKATRFSSSKDLLTLTFLEGSPSGALPLSAFLFGVGRSDLIEGIGEVTSLNLGCAEDLEAEPESLGAEILTPLNDFLHSGLLSLGTSQRFLNRLFRRENQFLGIPLTIPKNLTDRDLITQLLSESIVGNNVAENHLSFILEKLRKLQDIVHPTSLLQVQFGTLLPYRREKDKNTCQTKEEKKGQRYS